MSTAINDFFYTNSFHVVSKLNIIGSILCLNVLRLTRSIIDIRGQPKLEILNPGLELKIL